MSNRRLVNRGRADQDSMQRNRVRESDVAQEPTPLPPYEPPTCALTPLARRTLDNLRANKDYSKYRKHLDASINALSNSIYENSDKLRLRKETLNRVGNRQREEDDGEQGEEDEKAAQKRMVIQGMASKVASLTAKADKAVRDLIDYSDELAMKDTMMKEVCSNIAAAPAPRPIGRRQRRQGSNDDENGGEEAEEDSEPEVEGSIVSAVELLKRAREEYATGYASKSMRSKYDTNHYRNFKKMVTMGVEGPEAIVPAVKTWFPEDKRNASAQGGSNEDDSDDDIVMESATVNLKCPLTTLIFKEPFSNDKCSHVYEKSAFLEYLNQSGVAFGARGQPKAPKQVKCVQVGCDVMLEEKDFHIDNVLLKHIKQAARQAARDAEEEEEDVPAPRGTQRNHPTQVDDYDDTVDVEEEQSQKFKRVKRERQQSHAPTRVESASPDPDEI